ncbi:MAG TPA: CHAT domain-containing protein [Bacteroidetes bacterium]|nr:CHAT domain-containing protein [Bacteroidota bacterium]
MTTRLVILNLFRFSRRVGAGRAFALASPQPQKGSTCPQCTTCPDPSGKPKKVQYLIAVFICVACQFAEAQNCDLPLLKIEINNFIKKGEFKEAEKSVKKWMDCARTGFEFYEGNIFASNIKRYRHRNKKAYKYALSADSIWHTLPAELSKNKFQHILSMAEAAALAKRFNIAKNYLAQAESLININNKPETKEQAYYWFIKGLMAQRNNKDYKLAQEYYQSSLKLYLELAEAPTHYLTHILRFLGQRNREAGDYEQSLYYFQQELAVYMPVYDAGNKEIANANYNIGAVQYELQQYKEALESFLKTNETWKKYRKPGNRYMRYLNEGIGDMYWELGDREKALEFYDLAVADVPPVNNDASLEMLKKGDTLFASGQREQAMQYLQQALDWRTNTFGPQHYLTGACQNFIGKKLYESGNIDAAISTYQQTIRMMVPDMKDSARYANPAPELKVVSERNILESLASKGIALSDRYNRTKNKNDIYAAFETLQLAIYWMEKIRKQPISEATKSFWSGKHIRVFEKTIETAVYLYQLTGDHSYLQKAFAASEKSKAFLLLSALQNHEQNSLAGVPDDIILQENRLRKKIQEYEGKVGLEEQRCGEAREKQLSLWNEKLLNLKAEYDVLLKKIETDYPSYHALKYEVKNVETSSLQQQLLADGKSALIEFFEGEEHVFIFLLTKEKLDVFPVIRSEAYNIKLQQLLKNLNSPDLFLKNPAAAYDGFKQGASGLYDILLKPVLNNKNNIERLFIIPGGQLFFLPFECLLTSLPTGKDRNYNQLPYLVRTYSIAYSQSAALLLRSNNSQPKKKASKTYLGFAPDYNTARYEGLSLPPLFNNISEAKAAAKIFSGSALINNKATETAFKKSASAADILHLSLHTWLDQDDPMLSRLLFCPDEKEDGQLHNFELYNMELSAHLAILSACNTAAGKLRSGEGMMSLERGFQYAGCPSLLTTLWTVDDESSSALALSFLKNIKNKMPKDKALQSAQINYLKYADPAAAHPFYWAGFRMVGNIQAMENRRGYLFWGILFFVIISGGWFWKKRKNSKPTFL